MRDCFHFHYSGLNQLLVNIWLIYRLLVGFGISYTLLECPRPRLTDDSDMASRTSRSVSSEAAIEDNNLSGRAGEHVHRASCGEPREESQQGPDTKTPVHGGNKRSLQTNRESSTDNNTHKRQSPELVAKGRLDAELEGPSAINRYLQEGSSSDPEQRNERECFGRGRDGMRRYLEHWQQKWNAVTKRNNGT